MTAQLKSTIDRFYSVNSKLRKSSKKMLLIAAGADVDDWAMDALKIHFKTICHYLHWQEGGMILAFGASTVTDVKNSEYSIMARNLGKELYSDK